MGSLIFLHEAGPIGYKNSRGRVSNGVVLKRQGVGNTILPLYLSVSIAKLPFSVFFVGCHIASQNLSSDLLKVDYDGQ